MVESKFIMMYRMIVDWGSITEFSLKKCGFNDSEIDSLVSSGELKKGKDGLYYLNSIDGMVAASYDFIAMKDYKSAYAFAKKCYELKPDRKDLCFDLILHNMSYKSKHYDQVLKCVDDLLNSGDPLCCLYGDIYLRLLSFMIELPDSYKKYLKNVNNYNTKKQSLYEKSLSVKTLNKLRSLLIVGYVSAVPSFVEKEISDLSIPDRIIKKLSKIICLYKNSRYETLLEYFNKDDYDEALKYYILESEKRELTKEEKNVMYLLKTFIDLKNGASIPEKQPVVDICNLNIAIDNNDFDKALNIVNKFNDSQMKDVTKFLLEKIVGLINDRSKEKTSLSVDSPKQVFSDVLSHLANKDFDEVFILLKKYTNLIGASKYDFYVVDLVKLSVLDNDETYVKPLTCCMDLVLDKGEITIDIPTYIRDFYSSIINDKFDHAWLYLDIISNAAKINNVSVPINEFVDFLVRVEKLSKNNVNASTNGDSKTLSDNIKTVVKENMVKNTVGDSVNNNVDDTTLILLHIANTGLDVESACKELNIDSERMNMAKLNYAIEYFKQGMYDEGDSFLYSYMRSEGKTDNTEKLYKKILECRDYYINQKEEKSLVLSLTLKPDKNISN